MILKVHSVCCRTVAFSEVESILIYSPDYEVYVIKETCSTFV